MLEVALQGARANEERTVVNKRIRDHGAFPLSVDEYDKIVKMKKKTKTRYSYNFDVLKDEIREATPSYHPFQLGEDELLLAWWYEGHRRQNGERLPRRIWESTPNSERCLSLFAAAIIRHIIFSFNIPVSQFPALQCAFAVLLLGRALTDDEIFSVRAIRNNIMKLCLIDSYRISQTFEATFGITAKFPLGFPRYWYTTTDDTKHGKSDDRHVVIRTGDSGFDNEDDDDGFGLGNPFFDVLSAGVSSAKTTEGHVEHNVKVMAENCETLSTLSKYGGNASDNAAKKECEETFTATMQKVKDEMGSDEPTQVFYVTEKAFVTWIHFIVVILPFNMPPRRALARPRRVITDRSTTANFSRLSMILLYVIKTLPNRYPMIFC